jgi:hypothetical protein
MIQPMSFWFWAWPNLGRARSWRGLDVLRSRQQLLGCRGLFLGYNQRLVVPASQRVVTRLTVELADGDAFRDPDRVGRLLTAHRLTADTFLSAYALPAISGQ